MARIANASTNGSGTRAWCARAAPPPRSAQAGFVRLNGKRVTAPSHMVRIGDVVTLALDRAVRVIQVEGFCEKRGGAPAARALYRDLTTSSGAKACTSPAFP